MKTRKAINYGMLGDKRLATVLRRTSALADAALRSYGEPMLSLEELRCALAEQLPDMTLSEIVVREREAGW